MRYAPILFAIRSCLISYSYRALLLTNLEMTEMLPYSSKFCRASNVIFLGCIRLIYLFVCACGLLSVQQLLMLEATLLFGGMGLHDQHSDLRLDVDNMTYEVWHFCTC